MFPCWHVSKSCALRRELMHSVHQVSPYPLFSLLPPVRSAAPAQINLSAHPTTLDCMLPMKKSLFYLLVPALAAQFGLLSSHAWDYEGHRLVNQLALASLPTNFPQFVHAAAAVERIAFLA